jgi:hypothetical protein
MNESGADHLKPGLKLPSIALPATDGTEIDLAALKGRSVVIVYPWTGRPASPIRPAGTSSKARTAPRPKWKAFATIMRTSCGSACGSSA